MRACSSARPAIARSLRLNTFSWEVMRGRRAVTLLQAKESKSKRTRIEEASWRDVDEALFESLRKLRREIAAERGVPAYVILHDATLRELASVRPSTMEAVAPYPRDGRKKARRLRRARARTNRAARAFAKRLIDSHAPSARAHRRSNHNPGSLGVSFHVWRERISPRYAVTFGNWLKLKPAFSITFSTGP